MMNFPFKTRNCVLRTRNCVFKTRNSVFKMMNFAELPEPPVPPDPDDPFGLGPTPPPMAGADGSVTPEQAGQMAQMAAERAMASQSMASRVLSRIRAPFGGGGGEDGAVATGVAAVGAAGGGTSSGSGLARAAGWVWPLSRM